MLSHVHARPQKEHTFATQARAMSRERRSPVRMDDSMTRHLRIVAVAQRVADRARGERAPGEHPYEAICRNAPTRNPYNDREHRASPCLRGHPANHGHTAARGADSSRCPRGGVACRHSPDRTRPRRPPHHAPRPAPSPPGHRRVDGARGAGRPPLDAPFLYLAAMGSRRRAITRATTRPRSSRCSRF